MTDDATFLSRIADQTRLDVARRRAALPQPELERRCAAARPRPCAGSHPFYRALRLRDGHPRIIAELKRASPSKGPIRLDLDLADVAQDYERQGAAAISVLTEEHFFRGSLDVLRAVRQRVRLPLLRKDFILDDYQLFEAVDAGADAVLLIAALLTDDDTLAHFLRRAHELGLETLCEAHTEAEVQRLLALNADIIGVNCRDLTTFTLHPERSEQLLAQLPADCATVAESGIAAPDDLRQFPSADAFLIGETLMRHGDPGDNLRRFTASPHREARR